MPRFTLTLKEEEFPEAPKEEAPKDGFISYSSFPVTFVHFEHHFRELPHDKIQQIMAILTKPPRAPRIDKGKPRKRNTDQTPPLPGT